MDTIRQSTTSERPLQASKWLSSQALLDPSEMSDLFDFAGDFYLFICGNLCQKGEGEIGRRQFLDRYREYVDQLKGGIVPDPSIYRTFFSPAMTVTKEALFAVAVDESREIIRVARPVVQMQGHNMSYSTVDKKFHPMVFGMDSISWGVQFSYPQLYQDNVTKNIDNVRDTPDFPNTKLFHAIQKWLRQNTIPTPFLAEGKQINVPMRLGKQCLSWINQHPQLIKKGIAVKC